VCIAAPAFWPPYHHFFIVHALVSSSPVVKKVIKFKSSYDFLTKISVSESRGKPNSFLSSLDNPSASNSVATSKITQLFALSRVEGCAILPHSPLLLFRLISTILAYRLVIENLFKISFSSSVKFLINQNFFL